MLFVTLFQEAVATNGLDRLQNKSLKMERSEQTPSNSGINISQLNDSALEKPCPSTDCDWKFDLLCAPRPRARSRLNDSGFFEQDTATITSNAEEIDNCDSTSSREVIEDWTAMSSYSEEIFCYLYKLETKFLLSRDFLSHQKEVTYQSRAVLVDWLIQVHEFYNFPQDCLYLMISLLDRYMSWHYVPLTHFQLLGMACLLVACKYEDRFVPSQQELVSMADKAFTADELNKMEKCLLETLNFDLSQPLPSHFLRRIARAAGIDAETYVLSKFLMEITKLDLVLVTYKPSMIAASAFCLASALVWENGTLSESVPGSSYSLDQLMPCLVCIAKVVEILTSLGCKGVIQKYCRLGIDTTVIESLSLNPIIRDLLVSTQASVAQ